jgi:predicted double-glycine peptidase
VIELPGTVQETGHTCGAAALRSICAYYGCAPASEAELVAAMGFGEDGSDPAHVLRAVARYGLHHREYRPMTDRQLARCLDRGRPVLIMLQAWPDVAPPAGFANVWDSGHWVVAIGYDARGVYFMDPSIDGARGFLTHDALAERWHDIEGGDAHHVHRYGVAIWRQRVVGAQHVARVEPIA